MICIPAVGNTFFLVDPDRVDTSKIFTARSFVICVVAIVEKIASTDLEFLAPQVWEIDPERICFADTMFSKNDRESYVDAINNFYKGGLLTETDSLRQYSDQATNGYQLSANLAYTEPIGKKGQLQINYNPSYSKNKADQQTFQFNDGQGKYSLFDTSLSNKYDNDYTAQRGGITYRIGDRDNMFSVGASYQYAALKGDQVFPATTSLILRWRTSRLTSPAAD